MLRYDMQEVLDFANNVKNIGFTVYMGKSGTYGFYTDMQEKRIAYFQYWLGKGVQLSGICKPSKHGTSWRISLEHPAAYRDLQEALYSPIPHDNAPYAYKDVAEYLAKNKHSGYQILEGVSSMIGLQAYTDFVRKQTQDNDHNAAVTTIARYIQHKHKSLEGIEHLVKSCEALETLHKFYGHMPGHLQPVREDLRARCYSMMTEAEQTAFNNVI